MITHSDTFTMVDGVKHFDLTNTIQYLQYQGKELFGPHFKIAPVDHEIIYQILSWMVADPKVCEKYNLSPNKGLLLTGPVGCGKTSLMILFSKLLPRKKTFGIKPARDIAIEFNNHGYDVLHRYARSSKYANPICIDDIGIEPPVRYYGDRINVIGEILLSRYDLFRDHKVVTHGTTNLNADEIEEMYGIRVRSRLRGMFNLISFDTNSKDKRS